MNKKGNLNPSLEELVKKFSKSDVIAEMEKEYQSLSPTELPLREIDDSPFLKRVEPNPTLIEQMIPSIKQKGLFNPLVVRRVSSHYELILGRKRYFAAKKAGLESVPTAIKDADDEETLLMLLADTRDQREANVVEMAVLYDALSNRYGYSKNLLATLSHQSRSQVVNSMRILSLPDDVITMVSKGELSYGHARALCPLSSSLVHRAVREIVKNKLSVRETEVLASSLKGEKVDPTHPDLALLSGAQNVVEKENSLDFRFATKKEKENFISLLLGILNK